MKQNDVVNFVIEKISGIKFLRSYLWNYSLQRFII